VNLRVSIGQSVERLHNDVMECTIMDGQWKAAVLNPARQLLQFGWPATSIKFKHHVAVRLSGRSVER